MSKRSNTTRFSKPNVSIAAKKFKQGEDEFVPSHFLNWCREKGMLVSLKVKITENCSHRFGMIALQPIKKSEVLFVIPRSMLLWECNNSYGSIPGLQMLESKSGWVKLMLVLMLEYTDPNSRWAPYLQFSPPTEVIDTPIYWSSEIREEILAGTPLLSLVNTDIQNIENEYHNVALPFIETNAQYGFDKDEHTLELYKQMAGFIMAYSFTEPDDDSEGANSIKMVPMADVLNHVSKHNAHLQFDKESLKMVATRDIDEQCEVFNTYGCLSNSQSLQMYGFVEEGLSNVHDNVEIPVGYFKTCFDIPVIESKWKYLFEDDGALLQGCEVITIGRDGILSTEEAKIILKVLPMSPTEFEAQKVEEWESDSSESTSSADSDMVHVIPHKEISLFYPKWKSILKFVGEKFQEKLLGVLSEKHILTYPDGQNMIRKEKVIAMLQSQISILDGLIQACSD